MAAKKTNPVTEAEEQIAVPASPMLDIDDDDEDEDDYNQRLNLEENLTTAVPIKDNTYKGPRVQIFIPAPPESEDEGVKIDMYEHVTIANEKGEECTRILRGEWVEVPVPVYLQLKNKYPKL